MNKHIESVPRTIHESFHAAPTHFVSLSDWSRPRIEELLRFATHIKESPGQYARTLEGRVLLMMFQKPSLRTRVSFQSAMARLGGQAIDLDLAGSPWRAGRETAGDTVLTVSRYVDAIMARLFSHAEMLDLANHATVPVINGQTDLEHPCQALGDLLTLHEQFGDLNGLRLAYVGDARTNVVHSLLDACAKLGIHLSIGCPSMPDYQPDSAVVARARAVAANTGAHLEVVHEASRAVAGANAVYTDTWMSYQIPVGQREARKHVLSPFRVTSSLMKLARPEAVFLHCLPAWRGNELDAEVMDGPQSIVFAQAENRLHTEKAILLSLIR
ncbi:MAG TPA: ornithine carbamoyltransferase [Planctomycetota bacterium]|nr:ornithine carbamoyltransferase [Planctomycetota bacterium]